jgi:hypothetical protein
VRENKGSWRRGKMSESWEEKRGGGGVAGMEWD